jgi:hypothetical protein
MAAFSMSPHAIFPYRHISKSCALVARTTGLLDYGSILMTSSAFKYLVKEYIPSTEFWETQSNHYSSFIIQLSYTSVGMMRKLKADYMSLSFQKPFTVASCESLQHCVSG